MPEIYLGVGARHPWIPTRLTPTPMAIGASSNYTREVAGLMHLQTTLAALQGWAPHTNVTSAAAEDWAVAIVSPVILS